MIRRYEQDISVLFASLEDLTNGLVGGCDALDGSFVDTGMADHVWWSEIVHE